jgi:Raf kinase inhibitor-like YbhB/YbcL family protein
MPTLLMGSLAALLVCSGADGRMILATAGKGEAVKLTLTTSAFRDGAAIPKKFTADGADLSPALAWQGAPFGTQALVLIVDDPDAPMGTWVHWLVYDLPGSATGLAEGIGKGAKLPADSKEGANSWGNSAWGGPSPPKGKPHRYFFKLYALAKPVGLAAGVAKEELLKAMAGKILAEAQVMGTYGR